MGWIKKQIFSTPKYLNSHARNYTMNMSQHYSLLEKVYCDAPINANYHPSIKIAEKHAEITIELSPRYHHAAHAVHGAIIFKMLDDAGFFAANSVVPEVFVLTANFSIHYLRPVAEGILRSVGDVIHFGSRQIIADAKCYNSAGKVVAEGRGVYMRTQLPISQK